MKLVYIFTDGHMLYDNKYLTKEDESNYLEVEKLPEIKPIEGKIGAITGCNLETGEIKIEYFDIPEQEPDPPLPKIEPLPTDEELFMQALTDLELRSLEEQKDRQLLAQQVADLELAIIQGGVKNV